jgi:exonuclease III
MEADAEAEMFATAMKKVGFDGLWLSPDDTGPKQNRISTNASEWWVAFYRKSHLAPNLDHPNGFLTREKSGPTNLLLALNPIHSRVPYAFSFDALDPVSKEKINDFTIISVHLAPDDGKSAAPKRITEFRAILQWVGRMMKAHKERDYIIVGDANIANLAEYSAFLGKLSPKLEKKVAALETQIGDHQDYRGAGRAELEGKFSSLNQSLVGTNLKKNMPYDHVFWMPEYSTEVIPELFLIDTIRRFDKNQELSHSDFYQRYSDHHPIGYGWRLTPDDD